MRYCYGSLAIYISTNKFIESTYQIYQSIHRSFYLCIYPTIYPLGEEGGLSSTRHYLSIYPSVYIVINKSIYLSAYLSWWGRRISFGRTPSAAIPLHLSIYLSISLSIYLFIYLSFYVSILVRKEDKLRQDTKCMPSNPFTSIYLSIHLSCNFANECTICSTKHCVQEIYMN